MTFQVGDRVAYQDPPAIRPAECVVYVGTVTEIRHYKDEIDWVEVAWDDGSTSATNGASVLLRRLPIEFGSGKVA